MTDIEIIKKAISRKHPNDPCHEALNRIHKALKACSDELFTINGVYGDKKNSIDHSYGLELSMKIIGKEYSME